jgi:hypothetical protein
LPSVRVTVPGRDLVYAGGNPRITFDARATDDYGLRSLALHYTKVSGSGEQFEFKEGEIPLTLTRASSREWQGGAARSLDELDLKDGDMLVYRAVAADERPGDGSASSDAFFIEISKLGVAAGDAFTLPEEETRYALSQQMLIIKTERLQQRRAAMAAEELADAALNLAVEQRMIRAEFVFMLGGEVQDEEVEAEQSTELRKAGCGTAASGSSGRHHRDEPGRETADRNEHRRGARGRARRGDRAPASIRARPLHPPRLCQPRQPRSRASSHRRLERRLGLGTNESRGPRGSPCRSLAGRHGRPRCVPP